MVARGKFFLYDSIVPALEAGRYRLGGQIGIDATEDGDAATGLDVRPLDTHINVTAPRLKLPPDQALSTFPPANAEGAFEGRLPQIVLKKRTLPWDRKAAPDNTVFGDQRTTERTPWLALVVIAEGEGQIEHDIPWQDCVTDGVQLPGDKDVPTATRLSVPASVVRQVFPTVDDLTLLTHVREVNLDDTEAAMGDDDGFLAVVIANRIPQFDREECRPKAYTACLVNLEGQLGELPAPLPPRPFFDMADLLFSDVVAVASQAVRTGAAVPLQVTAQPRRLDVADGNAMADAIRRGEVVLHDGNLVDRAGATLDGIVNLGPIAGSAVLDGDFSSLADASIQASFKVDGTFGGFGIPVATLFQERIVRFPVLTSWRFTCTGAGSFEQLMRNLDVGLLGRRTGSGFARPLADCVADPGGRSSGEPPAARIPLEVAESGHLSLPYRSRVGEDEEAWYRGPFSPVRLRRRIPGSDGPTLAHVSDHLRMMTPRGIEDVSLAVAFETGRLLALSQPSFIAALRRWRAERFGAARGKAGIDFAVTGNLGLLPGEPIPADPLLALDKSLFARELEAGVMRILTRDPAAAIAGLRPTATPGNPIPALDGDPVGILSEGLGLSTETLASIRQAPDRTDGLTRIQQVRTPLVGAGRLEVGDAFEDRIKDTLDRGIAQLARFAVGPEALDSGDLGQLRDFDDLDAFLADRLERIER